LNRNVLVVAPHHDDECIGCGGLLVKLGLLGWTIYSVVVFAPLEGPDSAAGRKRLSEAKAAAKILKVIQSYDLGIACRESTTEEDIVWQLVPVFRSVQPALLLTQHEAERDPEHRKTHNACVEALWLSESNFRGDLGHPAQHISAVFCYEIWTPILRPALTINISKQFDRKLQALKCYGSQLESIDLLSAATGLNMYRGAMHGRGGYGESFSIVRIDENILSLAAL